MQAQTKALYTKVWTEKTPLTLAVVAQAAAVGIYMMNTAATNIQLLNLIIAIIAAFALDLIIVSTAFTPKYSRSAWIFAIITSLMALLFSVGIAVKVYNGDWLHAAFPTLVFFYSWFLSIVKADMAYRSGGTMQNTSGTITGLDRAVKHLYETGLSPTRIAKILGGNYQNRINEVKDILGISESEE